MIKILFVTSGLTHGGANKSLQNLLRIIDSDKYQVNIYSIYRCGPYDDLFKEYCLLPPISTSSLMSVLIKKGVKKNCSKIDFLTKIDTHLLKKRYLKIVASELSKGNYDVVVSFQEGFTTILASYINAKKHIAWVHCDYSRYLATVRKDETKTYEKYDYIVAVSNYTAEVFKSLIPSVSNKVISIHNVIDANYILELGKRKINNEIQGNVFSLVSVGRMDPVKRFPYIPQIARKLKDSKVLFNWYIIGSGGAEEKRVKQEIDKESVADCVHLLGSKDNPYSYMSKCSVLVCLSSSEACPNVINEGMILHLLVVSSDFPSAAEFIKNREDGIICSISEMADEIMSIYRKEKTTELMLNKMKTFKYDNYQSIEKIDYIFK